jgi:hypothetical protein
MAISKSTSQSVLKFEADVQRTKDRLLNLVSKKNQVKFSIDKGAALPFVQHATLEAYNLDLSRYISDAGQITLDNTLRGKQAFAYIAICAKYFPAPVYAGAEYVIAVSDRCIRDYLDLMGGFYDHFNSGAQGDSSRTSLTAAAAKFWNEDFVDVSLQDRIIKHTSRKKIDNLRLSKQSRVALENFVLGFGELQGFLEKDHLDWASIKQARRGLFYIDFIKLADRTSLTIEEIESLFHELEYDRYIKVRPHSDESSKRGITFSLHRRLRPYFGCGHLGTYGKSIEISSFAMSEMLAADEGYVPKAWAETVYAGLRPLISDNQLELGFE